MTNDSPCLATPPLREVLALALEHHQAGRLDEAEGLYRRVLDVLPGDSDALHLLGVLSRQRRRFDEAIALIGRAIAIAPKAAAFHNNLANTYREAGRVDEAIDSYRAALALEPDFALARRGLFDVLFYLGSQHRVARRYAESVAVTSEAITLQADCAPAHASLGMALHALGRWAEAEAAYRRALHIDPDHTEVKHNLRDTIVRQGRRSEAVQPLKDEVLARYAAAFGHPQPPAPLAITFEQAGARPFLPEWDGRVRQPTYASEEQAAFFVTRYLKTSFPGPDTIGYQARAGALATVPGGVVAGMHSALFDGAGRLVLDLFTDDLWLQSAGTLGNEIVAAGVAMAGGEVVRHDGDVLMANAAWAWNYYHFLTEAVPRLLLTRQALAGLPCAVLVPHDRPFQRQILDLLGVPESARIPTDGVCRRFDHVHCLGPFQNTMAMRPEAVNIVRRHLLPAAGAEDLGPGRRRLYISRADSSRKVVNEDAVYAALAPLGFERIVCSNLSVAEQIRTFASAAVVVGAHGANLTNALFMNGGGGGGVLVELMSRSYMTQPYWVIAEVVRANYGVLLCDDEDEHDPDVRNRNMVADVPALKTLLTTMGVT